VELILIGTATKFGQKLLIIQLSATGNITQIIANTLGIIILRLETRFYIATEISALIVAPT
jgi:hypothetical protein